MTKKSSELFQQGPQHQVKASDISLTDEMTKELNRLKKRKPDLSDHDVEEIKEWNDAVIGKFYRPIKKQVTLRLDSDVLDWFKNNADKYQTLINEACRNYMNQHR
jgi:uncharacterized protein (DUF4415 family)